MSNWNEYPLYDTYDVVVAGGGTAGFAAGATAARNGLKTLIVEEQAFLGGTSTGGGVGVFFGFEKDESNDKLHGIVGDMMHRMIDKKGTKGIITIYCLGLKDMDVPAGEYNDDTLKVVMDEIVAESGAKVLFHTRFIGADMENGQIKHLIIHNQKGIQRVAAKVFIDASFHAQLATDAGVPFVLGDPGGTIQPGTLMFKTANVHFDQYLQFPVPERKELARKGMESGEMAVNFLLARQLQNGAVFHNQSRAVVDPTNPESWSEAETLLRSQVIKISDWWIKNVPGFKNASLVSVSPFMGLRDSRRIIGKHVFSEEELMSGVDFEDAIAASSYPIDVHHHDGMIDNTLIRPAGGAYFIPYRSMVTNEISNLLVAGRCISADYTAHAGIRVTITCMRMGEAAGVAAKESIQSGIPVNELNGAGIKKIVRG